jgi:5-methylcytosine-specific restriction enzyme A
MKAIGGSKECSKCRRVLPTAMFHRGHKQPDGRVAYCKDCVREYAQQRGDYFAEYAARPEVRERRRAWHKSPAAKAASKAALQAYRRKHPDLAREWHRNYLRAHPEKNQEYCNRHRMRKLGNGGDFTAAAWTTLCAQYDYRCLACGRRTELTIDHIVPVSLGGSNDISNIQPLCQSCNSAKHDQVIDYRPRYTPGAAYWAQAGLFEEEA